MTAGASESWDRYLAELEGLIGLADERVRRGAAAEAALQEESRRLQLQMSSAERDLTGLEARNGRLQIAVRELARTAGVSAAPTSVPQEDALEFTDVPGEMKALEYDVDQLRRSLASVSASSASTVKLVDSNPAPAGCAERNDAESDGVRSAHDHASAKDHAASRKSRPDLHQARSGAERAPRYPRCELGREPLEPAKQGRSFPCRCSGRDHRAVIGREHGNGLCRL